MCVEGIRIPRWFTTSQKGGAHLTSCQIPSYVGIRWGHKLRKRLYMDFKIGGISTTTGPCLTCSQHNVPVAFSPPSSNALKITCRRKTAITLTERMSALDGLISDCRETTIPTDPTPAFLSGATVDCPASWLHSMSPAAAFTFEPSSFPGEAVAPLAILDRFLDAELIDSLGDGSPWTALVAYLLVTLSDCIPFVPCQPIAAALGASLGFERALPIAVLGQTTAGVLAFAAARGAAEAGAVGEAMRGLSPQAAEKFDELRKIGGVASSERADGKGVGGDGRVLMALVGLRLAPFWPFSAGNYLLGGATGVSFRSFLLATLLGSVLSNSISVGIGAGGAGWLSGGGFEELLNAF